MRHFKGPDFRSRYHALPTQAQELADKNFALLKQNPNHPSLHFKQIRDDLWSVRVGRHYRALAIEGGDGFQCFWIGSHANYDAMVK